MSINAMITEDDLLCSAMLCDLLEDNFPEVKVVGTAGNVRDSLQMLKEHPIDLLFLDIELPDGNGFDILTGCENRNFGVIVTTSYLSYAIGPSAFNMVDFIVKPVTSQSLQDAMNKYKQHSRIQSIKINKSTV